MYITVSVAFLPGTRGNSTQLLQPSSRDQRPRKPYGSGDRTQIQERIRKFIFSSNLCRDEPDSLVSYPRVSRELEISPWKKLVRRIEEISSFEETG